MEYPELITLLLIRELNVAVLCRDWTPLLLFT